MPAVRIIGPGRAGRALASALESAGWSVVDLLGRTDPVVSAAADVDLLVIATPDADVAAVAAAVSPSPSTVVAHVAGSLGLDVLSPHARRASLHPLRAIPDADTPLDGAWFAVAGDRLAADAVTAIGGRALPVDDEHRVAYHAAAAIASNHLVALLAQVERVAATAGVPLDAYLDLVRGAVDAVERVGPSAALTGPVSRGDWQTVLAHLESLDPVERPAYLALAAEAARLAGRVLPASIADLASRRAPARPEVIA